MLKSIVLDMIIPINIAIALYLWKEAHHADQADLDAWASRMATVCPEDKMQPGMILHSLHLNRAGLVCLACGAQLGQFFEYSYFVNRGSLNSS